jgi:amino acid transporter
MMLSPEALVLHGNLAGMSGLGFVVPMGFVLVVHALNAASWQAKAEIGTLRATFGACGAAWLLLAARPAVAVCLATAVLVTAGFVFNEVFVYWFPNFGFAALLLATLCLLNLAGPQFASRMQVLFVGTAVLGLMGLALAGLSAGEAQSTMPRDPAFFKWRAWGLAAIAFVGYDLLRDSAPDLEPAARARLTLIGLAAAGLILGAWNTAALLHADPARLAQTSIPHILAAKAILGPAGRVVMGLIAIAGAAAAVNVLFQAVARMTAAMADQDLLPSVFKKPQLPLAVITGATGLSMAFGFACSNLLDVSLRAGMILWLTTMGLKRLAPLLTGDPKRRHVFGHLVVLVTMPALAATLWWTDEDPFTLGSTILILAGIAAGLAAAGVFTARTMARNPVAGIHN